MADRFVSEKDLAESKKKRQEEWEKVRKAGDPEEVPDEEVDSRPLYDRLKEVRDRKQAEFDEEHRFKNMVRGLDNDEVEFLSMVSETKTRLDSEKQKEEKEVLAELSRAKSQISESVPSVSTIKIKPSVNQPPTKSSKQAEILLGAIKRSDSGAQSCVRKRPYHSTIYSNSIRPSARKIVGSLPGISGYDSSSESDSDSNFDSDSDSSCGLPVLPALMQTSPEKNEKAKQCPSETEVTEC